MEVNFESRDPEAKALRDLAVLRVRRVTRRLNWLVPRAHVNLTDVNGPRGGVDKRCSVRLETHAVGTVVVTSIARDWRAALEQALSRATRLLLRAWRRRADPGRVRGRALLHLD